MTLPFVHPWALLLLPLALLPWRRRGVDARGYSWLALLPPDPLATALGIGLKVIASLCIVGTAGGLAQSYWTPTPLEHVGRGAQIAVLLDRSRSMDQSFAGHGEAGSRESKGGAARRLLAEFARRREHDLMAMVVFSTMPVLVANFTARQAVIQAAIAAGDVGHGLADTDIGQGILAALRLFENQPYNGSRVVLLVSDGGAHLEPAVEQRIAELMKREHVALYWLYLRASHTPGLGLHGEAADMGAGSIAEDVPERALHRYFSSMGTPYHAYEAENPDALAQAIDDVGRLQSLPIRYAVPAVHHDLTRPAYGTAFACVLLLLLASFWEWRAWR